MVESKPSRLAEELRLGIEAARAGNDKVARVHLITVLKQDPENIPAMLWLAFVLPSPADTIRVLERVLTLQPNNERAKGGIRWARARLGQEPDIPEVERRAGAGKSAAAAARSRTDEASIRQQLLSGKVQKQAKKGVLAHRARRNIRPLVVIILLTSVLGFAAIGVGALALVPPDTLAAWWPVASSDLETEAVTAINQGNSDLTPATTNHPLARPVSLAAQSDTLVLQPARSDGLGVAVTGPETKVEQTEPAAGLFIQPLASGFGSIEPSALIGPALTGEVALPRPGDHVVLAHQPAYPGEKWIEVNLTAQQVTAWQGDVPVFTFAASTGLPNTPTVTGKYHIYWKLEKALMTGPGYYLPEVPYTMYFYGGYGLHGTYWHNNFGQPMSHGCVNLETGNAQKLFEWADPVIPSGQTQVTASADNPGTLVVVHQ